MKILIKSAWGSDDPTNAAFAFLHANAFAEAGHEVRIFLLGEAVNLMKDEMIASVTPVGWPPLSEIIPKTIAHRIPAQHLNRVLTGPCGPRHRSRGQKTPASLRRLI